MKKWKEPIVGVVAQQSRDPFQILISCLLSLRTKDETTAKATQRLFQLAAAPKTMVILPLPKIEKAIYPVGFYRTKAKNIKAICKELISLYSEKVTDLRP